MTKAQYRKKIEAARKYGTAQLGCGVVLIRWPDGSWSLRTADDQTIDTGWDPSQFEYIID